MRKPNDWTRFETCPVCHATWRCRRLRKPRGHVVFYPFEGIIVFDRFLSYPHPGRRVREVPYEEAPR